MVSIFHSFVWEVLIVNNIAIVYKQNGNREERNENRQVGKLSQMSFFIWRKMLEQHLKSENVD